MKSKKKPVRRKFQIPPPPGISTTRFAIGKFFASVEHWPKVFLGVAILVGVWRARAADIPVVVEALAKALETSAMVGWIVAACVLLCSILTIGFVLWIYRRELDRMARQRDELQEKIMDQKVQRSISNLK